METISKNDLTTYTSYAEIIGEPLGRLAVIHAFAESNLKVIERRVPTIHDFRSDNQAKLVTLDTGSSTQKANAAEDLFVDLKSAMTFGMSKHTPDECPIFRPYSKLINSMVKDKYDMEYNFELTDYQTIYKFVTQYLIQEGYNNPFGMIPFYRMPANYIVKILNYGIAPSAQIVNTHNIERVPEFLFDAGEFDYQQYCPGSRCFLHAANELVANYTGVRCIDEENNNVALDFYLYKALVRAAIPEAFKVLDLQAVP